MKHTFLFIAFCLFFSLGWAQESASDLIAKGINAEKLDLTKGLSTTILKLSLPTLKILMLSFSWANSRCAAPIPLKLPKASIRRC